MGRAKTQISTNRVCFSHPWYWNLERSIIPAHAAFLLRGLRWWSTAWRGQFEGAELAHCSTAGSKRLRVTVAACVSTTSSDIVHQWLDSRAAGRAATQHHQRLGESAESQYSHVAHMMMQASQRTSWADRAAPLAATWRLVDRLRDTGLWRQERGGGSLSVAQRRSACASAGQADSHDKGLRPQRRVAVLPQIPSCRPQQLLGGETAGPAQASRHWPHSVASPRSKTVPSLGSLARW